MAGIDAGVAGVAAPAPAGPAGGDGGVVAVVVGAPAKVDGKAAEQVLDEGEDAAAAVDLGQFVLFDHGAVGGQIQTGTLAADRMQVRPALPGIMPDLSAGGSSLPAATT